MGNITFTMIKPEAVESGNTGAILNRMEEGGFRIVSLKKVHLLSERKLVVRKYQKLLETERKYFFWNLCEISNGSVDPEISQK